MSDISEIVAELERLEKAATPGPWWQDQAEWKVHHGNACDRVVTCNHDENKVRDAEFIAYARNYLPAVLAALKEALLLRGKNRVARVALAKIEAK